MFGHHALHSAPTSLHQWLPALICGVAAVALEKVEDEVEPSQLNASRQSRDRYLGRIP
jgi:hypothetical protein